MTSTDVTSAMERVIAGLEYAAKTPPTVGEMLTQSKQPIWDALADARLIADRLSQLEAARESSYGKARRTCR